MRSARFLIAVFVFLPFICRAEDLPENPSITETMNSTINVLKKYSLSFDSEKIALSAVRALVMEADPKGQVFIAEEAKQFLDAQHGNVVQVALRVTRSNEQVMITEVLKDTDAEKAGLLAGEIITHIDKGDISALSLVDINQLLRGSSEESVLLNVQQDTNNVPKEIEVQRDTIQLDAIEIAEDLPTGIGYLKLNGIYEQSGKDIVSTLCGWIGPDHPGVILDLRDAGGTDLESVGDVASLFTEPATPLYIYRDAQNQVTLTRKSRPGASIDSPLVVLINGKTTGASEVLAAVLAGSVKGIILAGDPSQGDPLVREFVDLPNGWKVYIVTRKLVVSDGTVYDGQEGVKPDILSTPGVMEGYEPELTERKRKKMSDEEHEDLALRKRVRSDSVLQGAADLILGLKALNVGVSSDDKNSVD